MNMTDFEPLREMAPFTEDMFNRIIAFQEKEHPAWNAALPFAERIRGLPLHNLVFSNPDRDPARFGPTVAAYYPLREEMQKIAHYTRQIAGQPVICELFPGNGFIGSLLGREGPEVIGLQRTDIKPNQIEHFFDADCFCYHHGKLEELRFDAALVSWPPVGDNPTPALLTHAPALLIYVYTEHVDESSGARQTGSDDMLTDLDADYQEIDTWTVERPKDVLHAIWPDMTPSLEEVRQVRIYARRSLDDISLAPALPSISPYDWEQDLHMALLALQAKREVQARGFPA
jgi:hypothetical protein